MDYRKIEERADKFIDEIAKIEERIIAKARKESLLKKYEGEDRMIDSHSRVEYLKQLPPLEKWKTGLKKLDIAIGGGISPGQFISLTGGTKNGKTAFAKFIMRNMEHLNPIFFSFEETPDELLRKEIDWGNKIPKFYFPQVVIDSSDLEWIEEKILEGIVKYGSKVVFIDHLYFLIDYGENKDRFDLKILEVVKRIKIIARELNVAIVMLCHIRKSPTDKAPGIEDVADSRAIPQWSDKLWMIWREKEKDSLGKTTVSDYTNLYVALDRQTGASENITLTFDKGTYSEYESDFRNQTKIEL